MNLHKFPLFWNYNRKVFGGPEYSYTLRGISKTYEADMCCHNYAGCCANNHQ